MLFAYLKVLVPGQRNQSCLRLGEGLLKYRPIVVVHLGDVLPTSCGSRPIRLSLKSFFGLEKFLDQGLGKEGSFAKGRPIALGKDSLEKFCNISLPRAMVGGPRQRFFKKKRIILCRGPPETALGKDSIPGAGAVTAAFLCRVPVQPSAKALPNAR